jgi:hypothetical protein
MPPMELLERRDIPAVRRRSIRVALDVIDLLDRRLAPLEHEPIRCRADARLALLDSILGRGRPARCDTGIGVR